MHGDSPFFWWDLRKPFARTHQAPLIFIATRVVFLLTTSHPHSTMHRAALDGHHR